MNKSVAFNAIDFFLSETNREQKKVRFFGGEPLLQWELIVDVVEYAKKKNKAVVFDVTTNGTMLKKSHIDFFEANPSLDLIVSFYPAHFKKISAIWKKHPYAKNITVNIKIDPQSVSRLFAQVQYLWNIGVKKFNFLPAYYTEWTPLQQSALKSQFQKVSIFFKLLGKNAVYVKNRHVQGSIPLFNTAIIVDCDGSMYGNNIVLDERAKKIKKDFILSVDGAARNQIEANIKDSLENTLSKVFSQRILNDTLAVDALLTEFVHSL